MSTAVITGGSGFFGSILKLQLLNSGWQCISIDLLPDETVHPSLRVVQGDLRDREIAASLFDGRPVDAVFHCAALLAHAVDDERLLWSSNVDGTRVLADASAQNGVGTMVFVSSNCLWGRGVGHTVSEDEPPEPFEIYGRSKLEAEQLLSGYRDRMKVVVLRSPTIVDSGRLGLLTILFEFIADGKRVWTVGDGSNRYQFVYAPDLADACLRSVEFGRSATFNIGSDDVPTLRDAYEFVIARAGTTARLARLPRRTTMLAMRLANRMGISPLGPYHYRMIAEDFVFDTSKAKRELGWRPTLTNGEMLWQAYQYYVEQRDSPADRSQVSPHRQAAEMGVIRLLKLIS